MTFFARRVAILSPVAWRTTPRHSDAWKTVTSNITEDLVSGGWDATLFASGDSEVDAKVAECVHISEAFDHAAAFKLIHNHYDFMVSGTPVSTTKIVPNAAVVKHGVQIGPWYPLLHTAQGLLSIYDGVSRVMDGSLWRPGVVLHDLQNPAVMRGVSEEWRLHLENWWEVAAYVHNAVFFGGADTVMCTVEASITDLVGLCLLKGRPVM